MASSGVLPYTIITDKDIGASIENAVRSHFLEISAIRQVRAEKSGSVLAVVTFPNDSGLGVACDGRKWERAEIRMDHDKLMTLRSNKIRDMFKPRAQERFRRQLNMKTLPDGIEFVLDFTPPREGPELAELTAALWLPKMVRLWFLAGQYLPDRYLATGADHQQRPLADSAVGSIMALGHDDVCKKDNCRLVDLSDWKINEKVCGIVGDDGVTQNYIPAFRNVEDYCPIRHRVAIIRVLRTINGNGLLLNSAVRMWTVAQVAIYLEVPDVVVDYVTQWLVAVPNTKFVEICPEKAFQLAYALKIPSVLAAAFRILVNERAIDYAAKQPSPRLPRYTWAGRERDDYGDFPSDPVEYASRAFTERMNAKYQLLLTDDVFDHLPEILEWEKFKYAGTLIREMVPCETQRVLQDAYDGLKQALVSLFHTIVRKAVDKDTFEFDNVIHSQRKHYIKDRAQKLGAIYQGLCTEQKILTPFFWHALRSFSPYSEFAFSKHLDKQVQHYVLAYNLAVNRAINAGLLPPSSEWRWSDREEQDQGASFVISGFHPQLEMSVRYFYNTVFDGRNDRSLPFFLSDHHLLALEDNELKYLPIWADGLDDGSGGVFQDVIPSTDMGPSEPGPAYHTGWTVAGTDVNDDETVRYAVSTIGASDLGIDGLDIDDATIARSISVQDTTISSMVPADLNPRRVVALPSAPSTTASSDQFGFSDDGEFAQAKYALPADHQAQGAALASYVEDVSSSVAGDKIANANANANANGPRFTDHETNTAVAFIGDILDGDDGDYDDDDSTSTLDGFDDFDSDMDIDDEN